MQPMEVWTTFREEAQRALAPLRRASRQGCAKTSLLHRHSLGSRLVSRFGKPWSFQASLST